MKGKQTKLEIFNNAISGAYYNTLIKSAKELENSNLKKQPYADEE